MDSPLHRYVAVFILFFLGDARFMILRSFHSCILVLPLPFSVSYASLYSTARSHTVNLHTFQIFVKFPVCITAPHGAVDVRLVSVSTLVIL